MRTIFYNYFLPYKHFFIDDSNIETISSIKDFVAEWKKEEECVIVLPVQTFDLIGYDIRFAFREFARDDRKRFILIGDKKQIEFSLSQNDQFIKNLIDEVELPIFAETLEYTIKHKINSIKARTKKE